MCVKYNVIIVFLNPGFFLQRAKITCNILNQVGHYYILVHVIVRKDEHVSQFSVLSANIFYFCRLKDWNGWCLCITTI